MNETAHQNGYHTFLDVDNQWRWRFMQNGNEIFRSSEGYWNRPDSDRGIQIAKDSFLAPVFGPPKGRPSAYEQLTRPLPSAEFMPLVGALLRTRPLAQFDAQPLTRPNLLEMLARRES